VFRPAWTPDATRLTPARTPDATVFRPAWTPDATVFRPAWTPDATRLTPAWTPDATRLTPAWTPDATYLTPAWTPDASVSKYRMTIINMSTICIQFMNFISFEICIKSVVLFAKEIKSYPAICVHPIYEFYFFRDLE
jgi:hypothetical protein